MSTSTSTAVQPIIVKKRKAAVHAHHGGAWKVAYADFVTAMMAFFLLLWLLGSTTKEEQKAVAGYFNDPSGSPVGQGGGLNMPGTGMTGPGGANSGIIDLNNPLTQPESKASPAAADLKDASNAELAAEQAAREKRSLDTLQEELEKELAKDDSAFIKLKDQILIDQTALGLRIQIVDKKNRPMFDLGSSVLHEYAEEVLYALAPRLNGVTNKLSVNGHTDAVTYAPGADYTNWELSADRANSARRSLLDGGYPDEKVLTVQGMGSSVPRVEDETDPTNRRIVILVLKNEVEQALKGTTLQSKSQDEFLDATEPPAAEKDPAADSPAMAATGTDADFNALNGVSGIEVHEEAGDEEANAPH
jgi:chemotaxis protein MotB